MCCVSECADAEVLMCVVCVLSSPTQNDVMGVGGINT